MASALELLGEVGTVQQEGIKSNSALDLLQPIQAERFPTTPLAQKSLTLEGELGLGKAKDSTVRPFDIVVPKGTDPKVMAEGIVKDGVPAVESKVEPNKYNDAVRRYYESGESPWMLPFIPGQGIETGVTPGSYDASGKLVGPSIQSPLGPEPPGGRDKEGRPLDENGKPYVVPSMSGEIGKAVSTLSRHIYTKATAVAEEIGTQVGNISDDLFKAYDNLTKTNPNMANAIKGNAIALETLAGVGSGLINALVHPVTKHTQVAMGKSEEEATEFANKAAMETTYQPVTEEGKALTEAVTKVLGIPFELAGTYIAKPARKLFEESIGDIIKGYGGRPEIAGSLIEDMLTFYFGAKAIGKGPEIVKAATDAIGAKRVEGSLGYTPSVVPPKTPYTGTEFKPMVPPVITGGEVKTNASAQELLEPSKIEPAVTKAEVKVEPEITKDPLTTMIEKAQAKIEEVNKTQADLEAARKAVKETPIEEVIAEELKVKGEKIEEIRKGEVEPEVEIESEGLDIDALEEAFPEPKPQESITLKNGQMVDLSYKDKTVTATNTKGEVIGELFVGEDQFTVADMEVKDPYKRQGVATAMHDLVEKVEGKKLETAPIQSDDARAFYKDRLKINETKAEVPIIDEVVKPKRKVVRKKKEPVTELDEQLGTPGPELLQPSNPKHPFRDSNVEYTNTMSKMFKEKLQGAGRSIEVYTRYAINEVNRYLNGEDVNIEKVREVLSDLSSKAEDARNQFDRTDDFVAWQRTVGEAAKWARGTDRLKINGSGGTQLNMMIPVDQIPDFVKDVLKGIKVAVKKPFDAIKDSGLGGPKDKIKRYLDGLDTWEEAKANGVTGELSKAYGSQFRSDPSLYRNKEIFDKTGYWLGKDYKWRYEIGSEFKISTKLLDTDNSSKASFGMATNITNVIDYPELYKAVPEAKDINIRLNRNMSNSDGTYNSEYKLIDIKRPDKSIITHELQHAVNDIVGSKFKGTNPGFERAKIDAEFYTKIRELVKAPSLKEYIDTIQRYSQGRMPSFSALAKEVELKGDLEAASKILDLKDEYQVASATDRYMKNPGEMEARLATRRMEMTEKERKAEPPWETLDKMLGDEEFVNTPDYAGKYGELDNMRKAASKTGSTLYMGIDPTQIPEATHKIIEGAKKLAAYTNQARGMKEWKPTAAAKILREEFNRSFVDRSGNIRQKLLNDLGNQGYEIVQKMYLSKGASSLAAQQLKQMRGEVYDGLNRTERRVLDNLILADRMLDIGKYKTAKEFKFPEGLSPIEAAAYNELFQFTEKLTGEQASLLRDRAKAYFDWMKKPLKDMLDAELISEQEFNDLSSHNYRRIKLVDVFDKRSVSKTGKTKRTVYDSGVEALSRGRDTDIFEPSSEVMALEVFNRAYGRILNNGANRTLLDLARQDKTNPFVRVKETPKDGIPTGWDRVFVYEKGERKALYLSPEMSKEWITNSPEMSYKMSQFLRYASGSPVLRTFATGINWGFALANLPRDIMHSWFAARTFKDGKWEPVFNSNMPVAAYQFGRNYGKVFSDTIRRKGRYEDYIREGGGMEFLVHQGRLMQRGRHIEGGLDKVMDFMGWFGETSEIATRLNIREQVIINKAKEKGITYEQALKDKVITQEATFAARDYMDFGQGGGLGKALDNAFPYLNASIQGTRGLFRSYKDNPLQSAYKTAQFAALVTGLYIYNNAQNPETMKSLKGNIDMQNNLVIPLGDGFSYLDEKGQTRYPYIKIPLDPGQRFFKTFFEASTDKWLGNQVDVDAVTNTLSQVSPVGISSLPPTVSGALGYMYNKDFWKNEDIWKKTDKPFNWPNSKQEFIPGQTPQAMIDLGSATGLSPERSKHAIEQLITGGSEWAWLSGYGYDQIFGDLTKDQREQHLAEVLSKTPVFKRFIGVTNPYSQFASPIEKAREDSSLQRWVENRGLDALVDGYLVHKNTKESEITDYIAKSRDKDTADRLMERYKFSVKIKDLPNRSFWLALKGTPDTEARAKLYVERYDKATVKQKAELDNEVGVINQAGGVISDEFKKEVGRLRSINN